MIELNNIRISLGLTWNEFYLCYLVQDQTKLSEYCTMSRNQLAENLGVSKQAIIDLVKKLDRIGYVTNDTGKLKCTGNWSRNFTEALEFNTSSGKETLPASNSVDKETLPLSNCSDKESLPAGDQTVKKVDHLQKDSGKETLPADIPAVKNLYQQQPENIALNQEAVKKLYQDGKETLPAEPSSDLYIHTKEELLNKELLTEEKEKGSGEKQNPYLLTFKDGIATCEVLRESCKQFNAEHPDEYPMEMYKKFIRYWSTPDKKNIPKWYKELKSKKGTWHLPGRLVTWHENDLKFNKSTSNGKSNQRGGSTLRPTSIAEPSKRVGAGNVAHVEF